MARLGLDTDIVDRDIYRRAIRRFRDMRIVLPTFRALASPATIPDATARALDAGARASPSTSSCRSRSPARRPASSWRSATASR
jgi:hypothetical protein